MLLCVFSIPVSAETIDSSVYRVISQGYLIDYLGDKKGNVNLVCYPYNGQQESGEASSYFQFERTGNLTFFSGHSIRAQSNQILIPKGNDTVFVMTNISDKFKLDKPSDSTTDYIATFTHRANVTIKAYITYTDGQAKAVSGKVTTKSNGSKSIEMSFVPEKDVSEMYFSLTSTWSADEVSQYADEQYRNGYYLWDTLGTVYIGELDANGYQFDVRQQSEEAGLLSSILEWIKGIFDSIAELPGKLWKAIEDGLKALFVPDEDYIVGYKDRWEQLLEQKLGAVYQVINLTFESWERVTASDTTNTIKLPKTTIPLGNTDFSFGGYDVKIVPDGFEFLVDIIKTLVGGLCTILFINGLRKRYDEIMGVEE